MESNSLNKMSVKENKDFWFGRLNKAIRFYFYVQRGLGLLNEARYLIMAIMAVYVVLKLNNPLIMVGMFVCALPVLGVLGWFFTFKMAKVMDFLNVKFSTHYGKYSIELQERQVAALEKLTGINQAVTKP